MGKPGCGLFAGRWTVALHPMSHRAAFTLSIIICTHNRSVLLPRALASVQRTARTNSEIIVVDDGSDEPLDLSSPKDYPLSLIRTEHRGVGAARAAGLAAAQGEFIAYCDDDDEWTPDHLDVLLGYLQAHPDVALVYGDAAWVDDEALPAASFPARPRLGEFDQIRVSCVVHQAEAARDVGGFDPSFRAYEDLDLWGRMAEAHRFHHLPVVVATHHRHAGCVTATDHPNERTRLLRLMPGRRRWLTHRAPSFAAARRFDPGTWQPDRRQLVWSSPLRLEESFGVAARHLLLAAERVGIDIRLSSTPGHGVTGLDHFLKPWDSRGRLTFSFEYWQRIKPLDAEHLALYTMRESTLIPKPRVNGINQTATLLYVPCRQNVESFRASGVRVPIKVLHHGVDTAEFPYLERLRMGTEPFTFGTFGNLSPRKGIDVLIRAFTEEFASREPVRLLLKSVEPIARPADPRIEVISGFATNNQICELLRQMDAFVLPSRGEGFGLCAIEAMATGLPLIATNWSGPVEYLDPADSFPLDYRLVDTNATETHGVRHFGQWAEPDVDHLRFLLRHLYEHPAEAAHRGSLASARIRRDWIWDRPAQQLRDDLDLLALGVSPG